MSEFYFFFWHYGWLASLYINVLHYFLCSLLLRRECCTFSNGEYVKSGLAELEKWIVSAKEEVNAVFSSSNCYSDWSKQDLGLNYYVIQFAGTSWHELNYIRQAVGFLVWVILLWFALCRCWLIYTFLHSVLCNFYR